MIYRFTDFVLAPASRLLARGDEVLDVPKRVFNLMVYLMEHRERAVSRDELINQVWGRDNVSDNQLGQTVLLARRLLDDDGAKQRLIRTVSGFGYHWVGPVECVDSMPLPKVAMLGEQQAMLAPAPGSVDSETAVPVAATPPEAGRVPAVASRKPAPAGRRFPLVSSLSLASLLVLAAALYWQTPPPAITTANGASALAPPPIMQSSVWVLPVKLTAPEVAARWARLGLMDLFSERLREQGLKVVPVENVLSMLSTRGLDEHQLDPMELQREFAAKLVVQAQAQREGTQWSVKLTGIRSKGYPIRVQGSDADLAIAAQRASDALLKALGMPTGRSRHLTDPLLMSIRQDIRRTEFDAARARLAPLLAMQPVDADAQLIEIELELAMGRLDIARQLIDRAMTDPVIQADPNLQTRLLLRRDAHRRRVELAKLDEDLD